MLSVLIDSGLFAILLVSDVVNVLVEPGLLGVSVGSVMSEIEEVINEILETFVNARDAVTTKICVLLAPNLTPGCSTCRR